MTGASLTEEKVRLLNDHDLRVLIDQNAELRHCETFSISAVAASLTAFGITLKLTEAHGKAYFDIIFVPALLTGLFLTIVGGYAMFVGGRAEKKIKDLYESLAFRNEIQTDHFVRIQSYENYRSKRFGRHYLPYLVLWLGVIVSLTFLLLRGIELASIWFP